jgi:hypothetical protein
MKRPALKDKETFKRLQSAGLLGNYFRMWDTVQGVRDAEYTRLADGAVTQGIRQSVVYPGCSF